MKINDDAEIGTEFWVPVQYPSGIWRIQRLIAGENGRFVWSKSRGEYMHQPSYRLAYLDREVAIRECRDKIRKAYDKAYWDMSRAINRFNNMKKFILDNYMTCKEQRSE